MYLIYTVILILVVVSFLSGYYLSDYYAREQISLKTSRIEELEKENSELRSIIEHLEDRVLKLESEKIKLDTQLDHLDKELSRLITKLQDKDREIMRLNYSCVECGRERLELKNRLMEVRTVIDRLKNDRELLVILKTEPPANRTEARIFWNDTRAGLYKINPNLAITVDAIMLYLDSYFDWVESIPSDPTPEQLCNWILSFPPEAEAYGSNISKLREEIYIVVISDIGEALRILEELT